MRWATCVIKKEHLIWGTKSGAEIPALPPWSCLTLDMSLNFSEHNIYNGNDSIIIVWRILKHSKPGYLYTVEMQMKCNNGIWNNSVNCKMLLEYVQCHCSLRYIQKKLSRSQIVLLKMFWTLEKNIPDKILSTTVAYLLSGTRWFWLKLSCDMLNPPKEANYFQGNPVTGHLQSP